MEQKLYKEDVEYRIRKMEDSVRFDKAKLESFTRAVDPLIRDLTFEKSIMETWPSQIPVSDDYLRVVNKLLTRYEQSRRLFLSALYLKSLDASFLDVIDPFEENEKLRYEVLDKPIDGVLAYLKPEGIFVRTPMLCGRFICAFNSEGKRVATDRMPFFRNAVRVAIESADGFRDYPFLDFLEKTIHFLFVYNESSISIMDNDNHDTKCVQDAVVSFIPTGDAATTSPVYLSTVADNSIPEGTYVTVTRGLGSQLSDEKVVQFWRDTFIKDGIPSLPD